MNEIMRAKETKVTMKTKIRRDSLRLIEIVREACKKYDLSEIYEANYDAILDPKHASHTAYPKPLINWEDFDMVTNCAYCWTKNGSLIDLVISYNAPVGFRFYQLTVTKKTMLRVLDYIYIKTHQY